MASMKEGDTGQLIEFLRDRDAPCPVCGYNLRNLTGDVCPECQETLRLTIGLRHGRFGWLLAAVTPGLFSGIAAVLMLILILAVVLTGGGPVPPVIFPLGLVGLVSGVVALRLIVRRHRFVELQPQAQRKWALLVWAIHGAPFLGLLLLAIVTA
jgi:hypothetical protein